MNKEGKRAGQKDPPNAADERLLEGNDASFTVPDRQVQEKQGQNDRVEDDPEPDVHFEARLEIKPPQRGRGLFAAVLVPGGGYRDGSRGISGYGQRYPTQVGRKTCVQK